MHFVTLVEFSVLLNVSTSAPLLGQDALCRRLYSSMDTGFPWRYTRSHLSVRWRHVIPRGLNTPLRLEQAGFWTQMHWPLVDPCIEGENRLNIFLAPLVINTSAEDIHGLHFSWFSINFISFSVTSMTHMTPAWGWGTEGCSMHQRPSLLSFSESHLSSVTVQRLVTLVL